MFNVVLTKTKNKDDSLCENLGFAGVELNCYHYRPSDKLGLVEPVSQIYNMFG
jgi:hypothetical protein